MQVHEVRDQRQKKKQHAEIFDRLDHYVIECMSEFRS